MSRQLNRTNNGHRPNATSAEAMRTIIATVLAVLTAMLLLSLQITPDTANKSQLIEPHIPEPVAVVATAVVEQPVQSAPIVEPTPEPPATCASEIEKYGEWNQSIAHAVMMAESSNRADNHNDNVSTGDNSIGCFQINLLGYDNLLAKYRDAVTEGYMGEMTVDQLTAWLKDARNNVAVAHRMYVKSGWQPWQHTTCRYKVQCY